MKSKGEKERYAYLNAEFQRKARRDKKAFLSDQCKKIEESNRMGKTRGLFKKIRDTMGIFHAKMGSIKDRNIMDVTEEEDIKKSEFGAKNFIILWEKDGKTLETVSDFILGGSKITADGDCSHEIKRLSLLERKVMTNLDSIFKSRDITLPTKVHLVKAMVFPVVMYGCESWTVKKAEHQRIDAFELWC